MNSNDSSLEKIQQACRDERFRKVILELADAYLATIGDHSNNLGDWADLGSVLGLELLGSLAHQLHGNKQLEFEDIGESMNPIRTLWRLCFEKFAKENVCATNYVTSHWTSSTQQETHHQAQHAAIERGVNIERIFMIEKNLPELTLNELRHNVLRQLGVGVKLRAVRPNKADALLNISRLGTRDFIIFDNSVVYATYVDSAKDRRFAKKTKVRLLYDLVAIEEANEAWRTLMQISEELTDSSLRDWVDPYG